MSSSAPQDQKSAASVMSIAISVLAIKATSPPRRPKPLSMYWVKVERKLSMTPVPPMASLALRGGGLAGAPFVELFAGDVGPGAICGAGGVGDPLASPRKRRRLSAEARRQISS